MNLKLGLIPAMTVGIPVGVAVCAADAAARPPVQAFEDSVRIICRVRQGQEGLVRATAQSMGVGGEHIQATSIAAEDAALAQTFAQLGVIAVDSQLTWVQVERQHAQESLLSRFVIIEVSGCANTPQIVAGLAAHSTVFDSVQADAAGRVLGTAGPNDPLFSLQYGLENTGAPVGGVPGVPHADIGALSAWPLSGGAGITIAVLDTGVSRSHPDLAPKLVAGRNFVGSDPDATDDSVQVPHGTACAGIAAAASNDAYGITGVSWNARVMPVRVADQSGASSELMCANGIIWAVDHGARVISISLGFTSGTDYLRAAVAYASASGAVIVAAAGNTPGQPVYFPARLPEVLAVTATDNRDLLGPFCTTGPEVDVAAPGVQILTTTDSVTQPNAHRYETGTSMAAPFVSGIAALLVESAPWLSSAEVRRIIRETADDRGPAGFDPGYGHGRVNAVRALEALSGTDGVCIADWNGDGEVTPTDLFAFLNAFFSGQADVNGDGRTDSTDLFSYLQWYVTGC